MSTNERKRKAHLKSRKGCVQCKGRRRKCDETYPRCGQCQRLHTPCSFENASPQTSASPHSSFPTPISTLSAEHSDDRPADEANLELYSKFLLSCIAAEPFGILELTNETLHQFNDLVLSKPYLLKIVLAISALKIYLQDSSRHELVSRGSHFQTTALSFANPLCVSLPEEDSVGMLFFSGFTAIYNFAEGLISSESPSFNPVDTLLQCFQLVRGIRVLLDPHWQYFLSSPWVGPLLHTSMTIGFEHEASLSDMPPSHASLRAMAMGLEDDEQRSDCLKAIDNVFRYIGTLLRRTDDRIATRLILTWPHDIGPTLDSLIKQRRPIAFVLLAHYAALLHCGSKLWWISRWPGLILNHLDTVLGDEWAEFLAWPKEIVSSSLEAPYGENAQNAQP